MNGPMIFIGQTTYWIKHNKIQEASLWKIFVRDYVPSFHKDFAVGTNHSTQGQTSVPVEIETYMPLGT